ncbi:MAG: AmmeMemoRadiSam system protein B [Anaerolineae bacterium]|nr:AmmeMemoRadiSam system protein B [Anaerolineae bacterium]
MVGGGRIRRSVIAGSWYPGTVDVLEGTITRYLGNVEPMGLTGELLGLIVPHAGYVYSGQVAAHAYRQLEGISFDRVVVVSPVHRMFVGQYGVVDADYYETPLGLVEIDALWVDALAGMVTVNQVLRDSEHSLEIQLPFLQHMLGEFKLLPIMMGDQSLESCRILAEALVRVMGDERALLVASTDLSHFYRYSMALQLDGVVQKHVQEFDPEGLASALAAHRCEACGGGPMVTVMLAARSMGDSKAVVLKYANSGDVTGDHSQVVGYLAAAICRSSG